MIVELLAPAMKLFKFVGGELPLWMTEQKCTRTVQDLA